jgi:hypothetical protein
LRVKIAVTLSYNGIPLDAPVDIYIDNTYYTTLYTVNGYAETIIETEGKVFSASYKGSDDLEAILSHCVLAIDYGKVFDTAIASKLITHIPYTLRYGLTYLQWAKLKAKRIRDTLLIFYRKGAPVDLQTLAERVYIERLSKTSKLKWIPIKGSFTDFKPSPFMKNFLNYLISKLVTDGYILYGWCIETHDRARITEPSLDVTTSRIYSIGLYNKIVELRDTVTVQDKRIETAREDVKIKRYPRWTIVELRDSTHISDGTEAILNPPPTKITYQTKITRVPTLEYLERLCTWTP